MSQESGCVADGLSEVLPKQSAVPRRECARVKLVRFTRGGAN